VPPTGPPHTGHPFFADDVIGGHRPFVDGITRAVFLDAAGK